MTAPTPDSAPDNGQRVTLAVLSTKLDYLIEKVNGVCQRFDTHERRIDSLEKHAIATDSRLDQHKRAIAWAAGIAGSVLTAVIIALVLQRLGA